MLADQPTLCKQPLIPSQVIVVWVKLTVKADQHTLRCNIFASYPTLRSVQAEISPDALSSLSTQLPHFRDEISDVQVICPLHNTVSLAPNPQGHLRRSAACVPQERPDLAENKK